MVGRSSFKSGKWLHEFPRLGPRGPASKGWLAPSNCLRKESTRLWFNYPMFKQELNTKQIKCWYCWWLRSPGITSWGWYSLSHYLRGFYDHPRWFRISWINNSIWILFTVVQKLDFKVVDNRNVSGPSGSLQVLGISGQLYNFMVSIHHPTKYPTRLQFTTQKLEN